MWYLFSLHEKCSRHDGHVDHFVCHTSALVSNNRRECEIFSMMQNTIELQMYEYHFCELSYFERPVRSKVSMQMQWMKARPSLRHSFFFYFMRQILCMFAVCFCETENLIFSTSLASNAIVFIAFTFFALFSFSITTWRLKKCKMLLDYRFTIIFNFLDVMVRTWLCVVIRAMAFHLSCV